MPEVIIEAEDIAVVEKEAVVSVDLNSFDMELEPDEIEKAVYGDVEPQMKVVTKEIYESMTDKEKAEWIGIDGNDVYGSMKRFHEKMTSIGISYQYSSDETEEFCRLEEICRKESDRSKFYRNKETSR